MPFAIYLYGYIRLSAVDRKDVNHCLQPPGHFKEWMLRWPDITIILAFVAYLSNSTCTNSTSTVLFPTSYTSSAALTPVTPPVAYLEPADPILAPRKSKHTEIPSCFNTYVSLMGMLHTDTRYLVLAPKLETPNFRSPLTPSIQRILHPVHG